MAADPIDAAAELTQAETARAIARALQNKDDTLRKGICNYCLEPCAGAFCDEDCRDDWEREQLMKRINGRG